MYQAIKHLHITCVILSGTGFLLRAYWKFCQPARLERPWVRRLPHIIDSLLLASALTLAVLSRQYPFVDAWLSAKFVALLVYIVLGSFALKRARSPAAQALSFVLAVLVFAYIVSVALTHRPLPWLP
jgi:uncharacterized membrane protein SirB2